MAAATPVIIEAALNGATPKERNPHVPISPDELVEDALACIDAGASIIHVHCNPVGGPDDEVAERYLETFRPVWEKRPDALIYPTVNFGASGLSFGHLPRLAKEGLRVGLLDPGSLNFGRRADDGRLTGSFVYSNSFDRIGEIFALHEDLRLGPSLAIYEPGFLRATLAWHRAGRLPAGTMVKLYLSTEQGLTGAPFGLPPTRAALDAYLELLEGTGLEWAVSSVGGDVGRSEVGRLALQRGGHLHLGLEFYGGERQPTNLELVQEAAALCAEEGRPVASCDEAAAILGLPG
jgi:3-keto-5-aminohexanoate cleavage enzyme